MHQNVNFCESYNNVLRKNDARTKNYVPVKYVFAGKQMANILFIAIALRKANAEV